MDRGAKIDQIQNNNARFLDNFENRKTSINIAQPPGGKSTFSLAWGMPEPSQKTNNNNHYNNFF